MAAIITTTTTAAVVATGTIRTTDWPTCDHVDVLRKQVHDLVIVSGSGALNSVLIFSNEADSSAAIGPLHENSAFAFMLPTDDSNVPVGSVSVAGATGTALVSDRRALRRRGAARLVISEVVIVVVAAAAAAAATTGYDSCRH